MTRQGEAIVWLRNGYAYQGTITVEPGWVHCHGRRRINHGDWLDFGWVSDHTWPRREVKQVRWLDTEGEAA